MNCLKRFKPRLYTSYLLIISSVLCCCLGPTIPPFSSEAIPDLPPNQTDTDQARTKSFSFIYNGNPAVASTTGDNHQNLTLTFMVDRTHAWSRIQWPDSFTQIHHAGKTYVIPQEGEYYGYYGVEPRRNLTANQSLQANTWFGGMDKGRRPKTGLVFRLSMPAARIAYTYLFLQEYRILGYNIAINTCLHFVVRLANQFLGEILRVPVNLEECVIWFEDAARGNLNERIRVHKDVKILDIVLFDEKGIIQKEKETEELINLAGYEDWKSPSGWLGNDVYYDGFVPPWLKWFF